MQRNQWSCNNLQTPWMPPFHSLLPLMDNNVTTAFCFPVCSVGSVQLPLTWLTAVQCWAVQAGQSLVTAGPGHIQDIHPWPDSVRLVRLARTVIDPVWPDCLECLCVKCDYDSAASLLWCLQGTQLLDSCDHPWRLDTAESQSVLVGFLSRDMSNSCTCHLSVSENSEQNYLWNYSKSKREAGVDSYMSFSDFFRNGRTFYLTMECQ